MPELPEVETSCRGIAPFCVNASIDKVIIRQAKLRWPIDPELSEKLSGKTIQKVTRRGKYIQLKFEDMELMIHLGMSGSLRVVKSDKVPTKHDHLDLCLESGWCIRLNDPRRFGSVILNKEGTEHKLLAVLGVEPLSDDFNCNYFYSVCKKSQSPIKALIMNSHLIVGVGNIYAQEALFMAGIHPQRAANNISKQRIARLLESIKLILVKAIEAGGSSLKDFTSAQGKPGYFQQTLQVYGRSGLPCSGCKTPLKQTVIAQRTTVYCWRCQK